MLGAFLFRGDDVFKTVNVLSGGEKSRIALLKLLLKPINLLILDEPTNHLDMHSKDVLLKALKDFGGTVIFVSHDRGFIEELSTRVLELKDGKYRIFPGDYKYYIQRLEDESNGLIVTSEAINEKKTEIPSTIKSATQLSWEEQKRIDSEKRKIEKAIEKLELQISEEEEKKKVAENKLASPEVYSNGEKAKSVQQEIEKIEKKLEELNQQWEETALRLEEF